MIPRTLHLVWLNDTPRPPVYTRLLERFSRINHNWTICEWDETACVINRDVLDAIPAEARQYRSDVIRYEVLMRHGGVYADWDILWRRPLHPLCAAPAFVGYESGNILCNAVIGAAPYHPYTTALVTRLTDSFRQCRELSHGVGVHYATRTVIDFRASVSLLHKTAFHRLHGHGETTPEEAAVRHPAEFGTHLYQGAFSMDFVEAVEKLAHAD
jgi:hypothetical protein